jgi:hypothetical protein
MSDTHGDAGDLVLALRELGDRLDPGGTTVGATDPLADSIAGPLGDPNADPVTAAVDRIRAQTARWDGRSPGGPRTRHPRRTPRPHQTRARLLAAAAAVLVATAATVAVPGSRQAVARWLGMGGVTLTYGDDVPSAAGRSYDLGSPVPLARAVAGAQDAGWTLQAPAAAGHPDRAYVDQPAGSVTLAWAPAASLPEIDDSGLGLVVTAIPGTTDAGGMSKLTSAGTIVELVRVGDTPAYWIAGDLHVVAITDPDGQIVTHSSRLASNTLLWTEGEVTYRLESSLDREDAVALAEDLATIPG